MTRQEALRALWGRLLIVFAGIVVVGVAIAYYGAGLRTTVFIFLAGNIGGYVAIHRSLSELSDAELKELSGSWLAMIVPSFVGGILAFVLYLLFLSNILKGELFPDFHAREDAEPGFDTLLKQYGKSMSDYAKLLVWSFIAGFNQKYVVDVIDSIRSRS